MADINAVDLTAETLSSLDGTENVVGFDTAEGKKIPISVLADYVMQKKTQSIAGATQTPKAAVDALNDKAWVLDGLGYTTLATNSDLDNVVTPGCYAASNNIASSCTHTPYTSAFMLLVYQTLGAKWRKQILFAGSVDAIYTRTTTNTDSASSWSAWAKMPTRAEVDALKIKGTWTPSFERMTVSNVSGRYIRTGDLIVATANFTVSSLGSGNPYMLGTALPVTSTPLIPIGGTWASSAGNAGDFCNTTNNNSWFHKNGTAYSMSAEVGKTVNVTITYILS